MSPSIKIALLEPYYSGSHKYWADAYNRISKHEVNLFTLPGKYWKWRMHGGAVTLADKLMSDIKPDVILAGSMMDIALLKARLPKEWSGVPVAVYFHENQFAYPSSHENNKEETDYHYAFFNYTSALVADKVIFNSGYNMQSFLDALPGFLKMYPDARNLETIQEIKDKSMVVYPGIDVASIEAVETPKDEVPLILWNHRWEHDKGPEEFSELLLKLDKEGMPFHIALLGEQFGRLPEALQRLKDHFGDRVIADGFLPSRQAYLEILKRAMVLPVTSRHDFYGYSVLEAIAAGCIPLLPNDQVYPEYIPHLGDFCVYKNKEELFSKIKSILCNRPQQSPDNAFLEKHDQQNTISQLDDVLFALAQ